MVYVEDRAKALSNISVCFSAGSRGLRQLVHVELKKSSLRNQTLTQKASPLGLIR
jgi:hypothetical protein